MYSTDPEIRRFAIESLMQAGATAHRPVRLTKSRYEMLAELRYYLRRYVRFSELAAQEAGLTPRQYQALLAIKGFPNREKVTIGELAEQLQIAHHSAVGLVDRSVAQNLIAREPSTEDRRQVYVKLTKRGSEVLEQLAGIHRQEIRRLGPRLGLILDALMLDRKQ
jgi:DNA-binding MarR family transcriptional regulator